MAHRCRRGASVHPRELTEAELEEEVRQLRLEVQEIRSLVSEISNSPSEAALGRRRLQTSGGGGREGGGGLGWRVAELSE